MPTCWIVRHAQSTANLGAVTPDVATIPLSPLGQRQAARFAQWLTATPALVVTSPYARTGETAAPLLARFPGVRREEWPIHEFTYLSPERYAGTSPIDRRGAVDAYWTRSDPHHCDGPGAESLAQLFARVAAFEERLRAIDADTVVFTHGQFMQAMLFCKQTDAVSADGMRQFRAFCRQTPVPNTGVIELTVGGEPPSSWPIHTRHLGPEDLS